MLGRMVFVALVLALDLSTSAWTPLNAARSPFGRSPLTGP
jgi:hypothetical protein